MRREKVTSRMYIICDESCVCVVTTTVLRLAGVGYEISSTTAVRNSVLAGGEFQLVCDVTGDYDGLVDIFYWKKYLPESGASGVKVTAVADVQEQFKRTSRYHARLDKSVAFRVVLTITGTTSDRFDRQAACTSPVN